METRYKASNLIKVFVLASMLCFLPAVGSAAGGDCVMRDEDGYDRITYLVVDRSERLKNTRPLTQVFDMLELSISKSEEGERLIVGVITEHLGGTRIVMDRVHPEESIWKSRMKLLKKRKNFMTCLDGAKEKMLQQNESHKGSAILETLTFVADTLNGDRAKHKRIILHSDMVQNSDIISFYKSEDLGRAQALMGRVKNEGLLPELSGVRVYVTGTGGSGTGGDITDKSARRIEGFWRAYFNEARAELRFYGPLLPKL